jgi:putative uncharacterized protein (fragment)
MKKITFITIILSISCFCVAQIHGIKDSDPVAVESRTKADIVLSKFDTIPGKKILYSLQNKYYYIIFQQDSKYTEYFITIDSVCNILKIKRFEKDKEIVNLKMQRPSRNKKKKINQLENDRQTIKDAFNIHQYEKNIITSVPNATYIAGVPSYFVLKDENGKRYGEYCLFSITIPCPINPKLWAYLIKTLSENIN